MFKRVPAMKLALAIAYMVGLLCICVVDASFARTRFTRTLSMTSNSMRTFASFNIYKSKGAASLSIIPPTVTSTQSSQQQLPGRSISRAGAILFDFAPSRGPRDYDWTQKETFSLSAVECGAVISMSRQDSQEFLHDPNMGGPGMGSVIKKLRLTPMQDQSGLFLSLTRTSKDGGSFQLSLPVTWAEFAVVKSIIQFAIPHLLGFDKVLDIDNTDTTGSSQQQSSSSQQQQQFSAKSSGPTW